LFRELIILHQWTFQETNESDHGAILNCV